MLCTFNLHNVAIWKSPIWKTGSAFLLNNVAFALCSELNVFMLVHLVNGYTFNREPSI